MVANLLQTVSKLAVTETHLDVRDAWRAAHELVLGESGGEEKGFDLGKAAKLTASTA